ncbi:MAG: calcium-binding protein [Candidatus Nanopelagicales bacterium]|nr:calcium-binding protein [Candidatus Nanopelagicales bacterium]MDZ4248758.1 calcium-binding protein [Candidatus Nanopelagicales bacterium]
MWRKVVAIPTSMLTVAFFVVSTVVAAPAAPAAQAAPAATKAADSGKKSCTIVGTPGNDRIRGTKHRDVICGLGGRDIIKGLGGNDVIRGGAGNDVLKGGRGADSLEGGRGADQLSGGDRADDLDGGPGDDLLDGDEGGDDIDGGSGDDVCYMDPADTQASCRYDEKAPVFNLVSVPESVSPKRDRGRFEIRFRVSDDTRLSRYEIPQVSLNSRATNFPLMSVSLQSGDRHSGVWKATGVVEQDTAELPLKLEISATDEMGRLGRAEYPDLIRVEDGAALEYEPPELVSASVSGDTDGVLDVRSSSKTLTIVMRVKDAGAGVDPIGVHPSAEWDGMGHQGDSRRVSGDSHDGVYRQDFDIPKDSRSGTLYFKVYLKDRHGNLTVVELLNRKIRLLGVEPGTHVPELDSIRISPQRIATLNNSALVDVEYTAHDADGEAFTPGVYMSTWDGEAFWNPESIERISGTASNGTWRVRFRIPRGTPPGKLAVTWTVHQSGKYVYLASPGFPGYADFTPQQLGGQPGYVEVIDER